MKWNVTNGADVQTKENERHVKILMLNNDRPRDYFLCLFLMGLRELKNDTAGPLFRPICMTILVDFSVCIYLIYEGH